ncbi:glycosyltransferase [Geobacter pickeringii]|nr:glycosyltransferase [Geobacter pickeringii]
MVHLPPPVNGVTVMGEQVVHSARIRDRFRLSVLPLRSSASIADIGRLRPGKALRIATQALGLAWRCLLQRPALVYFTLTPNGKAFYRDLLYVGIMRLLGVRRLYHLHGKGISKSLNGPVSRVLYRLAFARSEVILLSPLLYDDASVVLKRSQCHFLANGIADPWSGNGKPSVPGNGVPRILFFSNLVVSKGLFVLLEALALLKENGVPFRASFAGAWESPAVEAEFNRIAAERGLDRLIEMCGPRYGDDKRHTFAAADIMAFPTHNDAYPVVVLEAMSHGLPVVSTYEGAIPDMIQDGVTGFLVPTQNPHLVADRLALLLNDADLRDRMGRAGRQRYLEGFTSTVFEANLTAIFEACCR